jgi:hypothetical protein
LLHSKLANTAKGLHCREDRGGRGRVKGSGLSETPNPEANTRPGRGGPGPYPYALFGGIETSS